MKSGLIKTILDEKQKLLDSLSTNYLLQLLKKAHDNKEYTIFNFNKTNLSQGDIQWEVDQRIDFKVGTK